MDTKETISRELEALYNEGAKIAQDLKKNQDKDGDFRFEYQRWYTRALRVVNVLAPDRYEEFKLYYEINPKRKYPTPSTYVIQDYLNGITLSNSESHSCNRVVLCFFNQLTIFRSMHERVDYILANIDVALLLRLQDAELKTAEQLMKVSVRAAGALVGVVIENHLQKLTENHGITIRKKNPAINDLSALLKDAGIFDQLTWRKIGYLADIRNICSHKKDAEPTKEQVIELIDGANWLIKNVV